MLSGEVKTSGRYNFVARVLQPNCHQKWYAPCIKGSHFSLEDAHLLEFTYPVFTRVPSGVTVGDSGFCCCVPCVLSVVNFFC